MKTWILNLLLLGTLLSWSESAFAQSPVPLLTTINNPTPANSDTFGGSLAALGNDRLIVGAEGAAAAYLFGLNGALLATFTNPPGASGFGAAVAGVGSDRVLVGAYSYFVGPAQAGRAYLFNTNGSLVTTFTNPFPATMEAFGWSVAAAGSDRVLIGTVGGAAYLFRTNGTLQTTFTNPAVATGGFGSSLAAIGSDRALIGAPYNGAGVAYLFRTNGTLLNTFPNPLPALAGNFGNAVAAVGNDRLLIGAMDYDGVKDAGGAAYLLSTNGTLLTTFTNPTPAANDLFGFAVTAVGSSRVLIGAYQDGTGNFQSGAAYLFSTNGMLLNTFTNPTPADQDWFAYSVAAVGSERVVIGGVWDATFAFRAGTAYLFTLPYPTLGITRNAGVVSVRWVAAETGLMLQQTDVLNSSPVWSNVTNSVSLNGLTNVVQQTLETTSRYFRLRRP